MSTGVARRSAPPARCRRSTRCGAWRRSGADAELVSRPDRVRGRGAAAGPGHGRRGGRAGAARGVRRARLQVGGRGVERPAGVGAVRGAAAAWWPPSRSPRGSGSTAAPLPARLPATAAAFGAGRASLRHVDVDRPCARQRRRRRRLTPEQWAGAEEQLAAKTADYTPSELYGWGTALVEALDQDGEEPDDRPPALVNELQLTRLPDGGGKLKGRFDDAAMFDAIAAVIDAKAKPLTGDDDRSAGERQAEALADVCGYVLDHGDVPGCGGHRPHVNVLVRLEDLENRARAAASTSADRCRRSRCGCCAAMRRSCRSSWTAPGSRWTSAGRPGRSRTGCAGQSPPATAAARIPAATGRRRGASATTSCRGSAAARRSCPTWRCCAGSTTGRSIPRSGSADPRRAAGVHPTRVDRPGAQAAAKSVAASRAGRFCTSGVTAASVQALGIGPLRRPGGARLLLVVQTPWPPPRRSARG